MSQMSSSQMSTLNKPSLMQNYVFQKPFSAIWPIFRFQTDPFHLCITFIRIITNLFIYLLSQFSF